MFKIGDKVTHIRYPDMGPRTVIAGPHYDKKGEVYFTIDYPNAQAPIKAEACYLNAVTSPSSFTHPSTHKSGYTQQNKKKLDPEVLDFDIVDTPEIDFDVRESTQESCAHEPGMTPINGMWICKHCGEDLDNV